MKKVIYLIVLVLLPFFSSCSSDDDGRDSDNPGKISVNVEEKSLVESANNSFAINLFKNVAKANEGKSFVISPLSVTCNMSMLAVGADGDTRAEIMNMLGYGATSIDAVNAMNRKFMQETPCLDSKTKIEIANLLLVDNGFGVLDSYSDNLKTFYQADKRTANFADMAGTVDIINDWCNKKTNGMIPELFAKGSHVDLLGLTLLNAVYFKGVWADKFDKAETKTEPFSLEDGRNMSVSMMRQTEVFGYTENDLCKMVSLPYGNGSFSMVVMLPGEGRTVAEVVDAMTMEKWQACLADMSKKTVDLHLPRFTVIYNDFIEGNIQNLGARRMFTADADFKNMVSSGTFSVGFVKHAVKIVVDEEGTEAAAVTGTGDVLSPNPDDVKRFYADRPFVYAIVENSTGQIYFIGTYMGKGN